MSYKQKFVKLEQSFRPRSKFKHTEVITEFYNLFGLADREISTLKYKYNNIVKYNQDLQKNVWGFFCIGAVFGAVIAIAMLVGLCP